MPQQQQQVITSATQQGLGSGGRLVGGSSPGYNLAAMDGYQQGQGFAANPAGVPVPARHHHQHAAQGYVAAATGGTGTGWADQLPQQQQQQASEYVDQGQAQGFAASGPAAAAGQQPGAFGLQQGQVQGYTQHITGAGVGTGQGGQVAYAPSSSQGYQQGFGGPQAPLTLTQFSTPRQQSGSFVAQGLQVRPGWRTPLFEGVPETEASSPSACLPTCLDAASAQVRCCAPPICLPCKISTLQMEAQACPVLKCSVHAAQLPRMLFTCCRHLQALVSTCQGSMLLAGLVGAVT